MTSAAAARAGTGKAAALSRPVRARVQCLVDRPFDRARLDAERGTALFARRSPATTSPAAASAPRAHRANAQRGA